MYQSENDVKKGRIGGYAIDKSVEIDDAEIRNKLAITSEFKDKGELQYESVFRVKKDTGMPTNRGEIGPQYDRDDNYSLYSGSKDIEQIEIDRNIRPQDRGEYLERVGEPRELSLDE